MVRQRPPLLSYFGKNPVSPIVSRVMSHNRSKNTAPELLLRRTLWQLGVRFRCHPEDIAGRPDIVARKSRVAVFVDGCFWHGCPRHFKPPKTRRMFWLEKIRRNRMTRNRVLGELRPSWKVFEFYECELDANLSGCASRVADAIAMKEPSKLAQLKRRRVP